MIETTRPDLKQALFVAHNQQEMILEAPCVLTFCADFHRMRQWQKLRGAASSYDDLTGFLTAAVDAVIAAQSIALAAEDRGYGICYMGTTLWAATKIAELLKLPDCVVPVTSLVMGTPAEDPAPRDRLPLASLHHRETYRADSDEQVLAWYAEREVSGWKRYQAHPRSRAALEASGVQNLAQFYASDLKYGKKLHAETSRAFLELLRAKGFWNF